jgi:hypothetical protein
MGFGNGLNSNNLKAELLKLTAKLAAETIAEDHA